MASNQKKRCACPSLAAVPTQLEPTTKRIWVRTRSPRPSGFLRAPLFSSTLRSARSNSVVPTRRYQSIVDLMLFFCRRFLRRRRDVSKLAVPDLAAGISVITDQTHTLERQFKSFAD